MKDNKNMTRRDALKTMGAMVATAALATTGLSAFAAPVKNQKDEKAKKRLVFYFTATGNSLYVARASAYKGFKSLQLSAKRVSEKAVSLFSFNIPDETNSGALRLKLYVNTLNPQTDSPNIIKVSYRTKDNDEWQYSEIVSSENNRWRQSVVELPSNVLPQIQVEGTAFAGSVLAIDNLEVEEIVEKNESGIYEPRLEADGNIVVFSLSGIKQNQSQKGISIVRQPNGTVIKTISR